MPVPPGGASVGALWNPIPSACQAGRSAALCLTRCLRARQFIWERHLLRNRVAHGSLMPWVSWLHEAACEPEEALPDSLLSPDLEVSAWLPRLGACPRTRPTPAVYTVYALAI